VQDNETIVYKTYGCVTEGILHASETATFLNPSLPENVLSIPKTKDGGPRTEERRRTVTKRHHYAIRGPREATMGAFKDSL